MCLEKLNNLFAVDHQLAKESEQEKSENKIVKRRDRCILEDDLQGARINEIFDARTPL